MKSNLPKTDATPSGRLYWRGLDELAQTPEFHDYLAHEFPAGVDELKDPVSRRHFMKIMSASFLLAGVGLGTSGCRRPEDKLMPFGKAAENFIHGTSQYFATAMPTRTGAVPLVAKAYEGRPVKLEGNPLFPGGNGGTDRYAQAAILNLYDPDRATRFAKLGNSGKLETVTAEAALEALNDLAKKFAANEGEGLALLGERKVCPSRRRLHGLIAKKYPKAKWYLHEAIDLDIHRRAAAQAFGKAVRPVFRYDRATTILALDCDFIGTEDNAHENIRRFTSGRKVEKSGGTMNRLYAVESLFTLTGMNADHRLRIPAGSVLNLAAAIAAELGVNAGGIAKPAGVEEKWIAECATDLKANGSKSLVVAGHRQPLAVHLLAHAINSALGNVGTTVELFADGAPAGVGTIADLAKSLSEGGVDTLAILGANPAYDAPADLNWAAAQAKAKTVVRLGYYEDESASGCHWHFPLAHFLESWGDAVTSNGTLVPIQPLIAPLFGGLADLEFLARIGGLAEAGAHKIVRETFAALTGDGSDAAWNMFLHDGFAKGTAASPVAGSLNASAVAEALSGAARPAPSKDSLEVVLTRDIKVDDGRYSNNGWLQEFPDPITKIVWDNVVLVSRKTARELGVQNNDVVEVKAGGRSVKGAIWTQPGMADYSLGISLGYGRKVKGRVAVGVGFDAYPLLATTAGYIVGGATVTKTGETYPISCTQTHWSMEGRAIVREGNLDHFNSEEFAKFVEAMNAPEAPTETPIYPNPFDEAKKTAHHQWGMSIDLSSCVGCGTCVMACQSENNIPIVGKDLVSRGREMHWLRIDRYFSADPKKRPDKFDAYKTREENQQFNEWIDDVQAVNQPMLCQHCEAAPCESVCPVNATTHDQEGLNVMVYNRCVGTRYCSNNCPYKVRRYNYLDYNKRTLKELKGPRYPTTLFHSTGGEWDLKRWWNDQEAGMREADEWDLIKMIKNPDVTVRMRGVMEKCTFCVQRIEGAKIAQKVKAGASGDVVVPDGTFTSACAQACPAEAIVFGNVADPESRVSKLKAQERDYTVLEFLKTKPRTTYLARLRNPNKAMPDYAEWPMSFEEYKDKNGDPFQPGHGPAGHDSSHGEAAPAHAGEKGAH